MATFWVQPTAQGNGLGGSEANAMTPASAMDEVGTGNKFWWKATGDYTIQDGANDCVIHLTNIGAEVLPIVHEGYVSTIGDGGIVTIDANANTLASPLISTAAGSNWAVFKGFQFTGGSGTGVNLNSGIGDNATFKNCRFDNNDGPGVHGDVNLLFLNCSIDNNGGNGATLDNSVHVASVIYNNGSRGIESDTACLVHCLAYNNGNTDVFYWVSSGVNVIAVNCTVDGDETGGNTAVNGFRNDDTGGPLIIVNCIVHDCADGIHADGDPGERCLFAHNVFTENTDDVFGVTGMEPDTDGLHAGGRGDQTTAAGFTNEAADDYSLTGSGSADAAGIDAKYTDDFWDSFNGATNPPTP